MHVGYWWETQKVRDHWEDQDVHNIKTNLRETGCNGMNWVELAQDRDQWRALVNTLMNLRIP
jgi:hypothetical protein